MRLIIKDILEPVVENISLAINHKKKQTKNSNFPKIQYKKLLKHKTRFFYETYKNVKLLLMFLPFKLPSAVNYCIKININNSQKQSMVSCKNSPTEHSIRG